MRTTLPHRGARRFMGLLAIMAGGCSGDGSPSSAPAVPAGSVQALTLSASTAQVAVGATVQLTATVSASNGASTAVDWTSSSATVASVANGIITGVAAGTTTITATSQFDRSKSATAAVTVVAAPVPAIASVSPTAVSAAAQTITVTGTNFQPGMSLAITTPRYGGGPPVYGSAALQSLTPTSFQVSVYFGVQGAYTLQLQTLGGMKSNVLTTSAQFRTTGATWIPEGVLLTDSTSGFPGGGIADVVALHLQDGRWRLIFNSNESAISPDGVTLTMERPMHGIVGAAPDGSVAHLPRAMQLASGKWRMYFGGGSGSATGIYSAISNDDGLTWTPEPGARILLSATNITLPQAFLSGLSIVPTRDGKWRGYFADQSPQTIPGTPIVMMSATSTDLLNWTLDPGVRIGVGAATLTNTALHPKAVLNADSSVTVFYYRSNASSEGMYASTSSDGVTFTKETLIESLGEGGDPEIVQVGSGLRMYYNWGDDHGGAIYSAFNASGNALMENVSSSRAGHRWFFPHPD